MKRLPTLLKSLACLLMAAALTPTASDAAPLPKPGPGDIENQQKAAHPPIIVIVGSDNVTVVRTIMCEYRENVGACLEEASLSAGGGEPLPPYDDNSTCTFVSGRARIGSYLGPFATANLNYDYYDLFIDTDITLRAPEL